MRDRTRMRSTSFPSDNPKSKIQNRKWAEFFAVAVALTVPAAGAEAQQPAKIPRVGVLVPGKPPTRPALEGFRLGLRELGYVEDKNIILELRFNDSEDAEKWAKVAQDLVRSKPDVILAGNAGASIGAQKATTSIPIVIGGTGGDPVELGLVESFARPGGNVTGMTFHGTALNQKRLELLKEAIPKISPVAVLLNPRASVGARNRNEIEAAARALSLKIQPLDVHAGDDLDGAFQAATQKRARSLLISQGALFATYRARIAELALKNRLPAISGESGFADVGGLMFYGADIPDTWRRSARYVDKILKGAKPTDLPVERTSKFELIVNLKTAKHIGVTVSPNVLARADKVIK